MDVYSHKMSEEVHQIRELNSSLEQSTSPTADSTGIGSTSLHHDSVNEEGILYGTPKSRTASPIVKPLPSIKNDNPIDDESTEDETPHPRRGNELQFLSSKVTTETVCVHKLCANTTSTIPKYSTPRSTGTVKNAQAGLESTLPNTQEERSSKEADRLLTLHPAFRRTKSGPPEQDAHTGRFRRMLSSASSRSTVSDSNVLQLTEQEQNHAQAWFAPFHDWASALPRVGLPPATVSETLKPWLQLKPRETFGIDGSNWATYHLRPVASCGLTSLWSWMWVTTHIYDPFSKQVFRRLKGLPYAVSSDGAHLFSLQQIEQPRLNYGATSQQSWWISLSRSTQQLFSFATCNRAVAEEK